jgi:hypothetical protein
MTGGTQPLSYQWQFGGTNIVNATNVSLALANVTTNQTGAYSVTVANWAGSVTSSNAILSVYESAASAVNVISIASGNQIQFNITGVPGFNYAVQASTNLVDWQTLITNGSPFSFTDTNAADIPQQFYRTLYVP